MFGSDASAVAPPIRGECVEKRAGLNPRDNAMRFIVLVKWSRWICSVPSMDRNGSFGRGLASLANLYISFVMSKAEVLSSSSSMLYERRNPVPNVTFFDDGIVNP